MVGETQDGPGQVNSKVPRNFPVFLLKKSEQKRSRKIPTVPQAFLQKNIETLHPLKQFFNILNPKTSWEVDGI